MPGKACGALPLAIALFLAALTVIKSANKPLALDEAMPFAWNARAITVEGIKVLGKRTAPHSKTTLLEISHPPLYTLLLALSFELFGEQTAHARLIGVFCLLLTIGLLGLIARQVFNRAAACRIWLIAVMLIVINPYLMQYALLVDIDNSILTTCLTATIYLFIRRLQTGRRRYLFATGLGLVASFWAKEMTPPILLAAIFLFLWFHAGLRQALRETAALTAIGVGGFILTWSLFCAGTNVPPLSFVEFTILNKGAAATPFSHLPTAGMKIKSMLYWLSPPLVVLFCCFVAGRIKTLRVSRRLEPADFLLVYVGLMFCYTMLYIPSATTNPLQKYDYPAVSIMVLAAAAGLHRVSPPLTAKTVGLFLLAGGALLGCYWLCHLPDPLLAVATNTLRFRSRTSLLLILPLPVIMLALKKLQPTFTWGRSLALAAGLVVLPQNAHVTARQMSDYTTSPSWNNYGERGLAQTIAYLARRVQPKDELVVRKDIGYYLNGMPGLAKVHWWYPMFRSEYAQMQADFAAINASGAITYVVVGPYDQREPARRVIQPHFHLEQVFGDFEIYRRRE
ncbi:MAG: glycosyltransferase family 39 protein [candidate division KSB1 bacterium]|nr:glycosyltransferase family 39 protein [candidate division KSB1 bacterium]MDZ7272873.1 glycosyltransferase family 39 protein [candidate division KSB1 bacterium]MDZ7284104.1 glycosyltransferase family 39 protein [candidate division KSB1 bacterium]MDZ7297498.1 glycosyltransferase family 39 protein [candidate division KSB1 bacterium]MDZ7305634.1 glycosyltransferase family 39 protein [candidate division KSB1 bacterium]